MPLTAHAYQPRRAALYRPQFLAFVTHYLAAALVLSDEALGPDATAGELAEETKTLLEAECLAFLTEPTVVSALAGATQRTYQQAGNDFWLTRCQHGSGYWDRSQVYGEAASQALNKACRAYAAVEWYRGDDELIYQA